MSRQQLISIVIPVYNESAGLQSFHDSLLSVLKKHTNVLFEIIYCDDGSQDSTVTLIREWCKKDQTIKLVCLSRNFGKENALTAGIVAATGDAIITIDGDGQHPVSLIPRFIDAWHSGAQVVVGVRSENGKTDPIKKFGSWLFYKIFNAAAKHTLVPGSTDYRLIAKQVQRAFMLLPESDRLTRGLIDWLGFKREYIYFAAKKRIHGKAQYSHHQLIQLASNSLVSMTPVPLYIFGWLGVFITISSFILGCAVFIEQILLSDPLTWNFTGTALLGILLLFLVGILLMAQGLLSLYVSHIHSQSKRRPLYIIDYESSAGISELHDVQE